MSNELVVVEPKNVLALFTEEDQIKAILDQVEFEVKSFEHDMTNDARRKKTASLARKVASTKTYLDGLGKDLVSDWKAKANIVDGSRKKMRDRLDELKAEARKPLTEWEEEQKAIEEARRVEAEKEAIRVEVESDHEVGLLMNEKRDRDIADALAKEIEAERLRVEKEEKERLEREARIAKEAKEKAEKAALARENELRLEKIRAVEREQEAKKQKEEAEKRAIEQAKQAELEKEQEAGRQRLFAIEQEQKRLADVEAAKQAEILRQKEAEQQAELDRIKNEANEKHSAKIHNEMMQAIINYGFEAGIAKAMITLLKDNKIPHVGKVQY